MDKYNCVLVDFDYEKTNTNFLEILENETSNRWIINQRITNNLHGNIIKDVIRFLIYFLYPLSILKYRKRIDKIVGWQQFYGLNYAFWCRLFHLKKINDLTVMTFIYKRKSGLVGTLYHKYMQYIITSKYIDRFICFSQSECEYYANLFSVDKSKFKFIPLGIDPINMPHIYDDGSIFATGRSNRDYDFFIRTVKDINHKVIIACDSYKNIKLPLNVIILKNCYDDEMLDLMAHCHCVAVPLKDLRMSSGQLVVLQAMALGKPVICTNSDGLKDYVINNVTGIILNNKEEEWINSINRLYTDSNFYKKISSSSLDTFYKVHTLKAMYKRIAQYLK